MKKTIAISVALLLLMGMLILPADALELDPSRTGSITATVSCEGAPVPGGTLTLYRVADVVVDNADHVYRLTAEYEPSGASLEDLGYDTAVKLATHTYEQGLQGLTKEIDDLGVVRFEDLELGLYLLIQWEPAEGFYELSPFLMSVPNNEDGVYVYDTASAPKQNPDQRPTEPPAEEPPTEQPTEPPTEPATEPPTEPSEKLPQTGQTNWPVPIMAVCGAFFVAAGLVMVCKGKENGDEI